jgi:hypothetical protein
VAVHRRSLDGAAAPSPSARRAVRGARRGGVSVPTAHVARSQTAVTHDGISRRELAAVAAALLLPIPLLAASGLRLPLPGAIERGVASLVPGSAFDVAVIEGAPPALSAPDSAVRSAAEPEAAPPAADPQAVSSTAATAASTDAPPTGSEKQAETTPAEPDSPSLPDPHTDDQSPPGQDDGAPDEDTSQSTAVEPVASADIEAGVRIAAEAAGTSVEIAVTDGGVTVDTGGAADVGPPLEVPIAPPPLPLPLP